MNNEKIKLRIIPMLILVLLGFLIHYITYAIPVENWPEIFLGKENQTKRLLLALPTPFLVLAIAPIVFKLFNKDKEKENL